jgi:alpha-1,3-mannosyltransferase
MFTFCNAHTVNLASSSPELRESLGSATVLNDGVGLDMASRRLFGSPFFENLNGTDFVPRLLAAADKPLRVYFLGAAPGIAEAAARQAAEGYPNVQIAGVTDGYFGEERTGAIVEAIRQSDANLVLVAMGQPRQEIWASRHFPNFAGPTICVGALFDFLAGRMPRAPMWMRRRRIEWAYRLLNEPRRLSGRYLVGNAAFLARVMRQRWFGTRI